MIDANILSRKDMSLRKKNMKSLSVFLAVTIAVIAATILSCESADSGSAAGVPPSGDVGDDNGAGGDSDVDGDGDADGDSDSESDQGPGPDTPWEEPSEESLKSDTDSGECDAENSLTYYLSSDDSNSMASPVLARSLIRAGHKVDANIIRIYEFLNYYSFDYPPPDSADVGVYSELRESVDDSDSYELQIGVRARDHNENERPRLNLTLSVDTSSSMEGDPIDLARDVCRAIAGSLAPGDTISIVSWNAEQNILLDGRSVTGPDDPEVLQKCGALSTGGATDLHAGLVQAYALARENRSRQGINRVVFVSDGKANAGIADAALIAEEAKDAEGYEIYLAGVGVGSGVGYYDTLMNVVTDAGKGSYLFIDSAKEAATAFGPRLRSNLDIAAKDVRVQLSLPPSFQIVDFHGEELSTNEENVEPQHLAPNDAMVIHQIIRTCDPSVVTMDADVLHIRADYADPITNMQRYKEASYTLQELLDANAERLVKGSAVVAYAEALAQLADLDGQAATDLIDETRVVIQAASDELGADSELAEIDSLLAEYYVQFE